MVYPNVSLEVVVRAYNAPDINPCVTYTEIDKPKRSTAYGANQTWEELLCDENLLSGWYRFVSGAGGEMPINNDIPAYHCGTHIPLYLNGTHPTVEDDVFNRTTCGNYLGSLCYQEYPMQVKNCSSYYVYFLIRTRGCSEAYCAGDELECQSGYVSPYGNFTPDCQDLDECTRDAHSCNHMCVNTAGSYYS
ncbi:oncoprotein-induced transcript 3 protein-like [Saccoglossus kowalevskii]|uniref:Oncoprotein-induced transcript 3 protein-like n=1 Tax=Saccoglossus kowalevskii TaxID=10224 RepID=A0ABM0MFS3_SACKO|nr:PREDICTED: oncoprotein-induced transcript 3 protein-like [Saccoglossus kowalevskii]